MRTSWEEAKASQNADNMRDMLLTNDFVPTDIKADIHVISGGKKQVILLVSLLLSKSDLDCLKTANRLLQMGATLPAQSLTIRERSDGQNISSYFFLLVHDTRELFLALRRDPTLINTQDENGETLAHHAAQHHKIIELMNILQSLDALSTVDFNIQDSNGNTALHLAVLRYDYRESRPDDFLGYAKIAATNGFNFDLLNHDGLAVIHLATTTTKIISTCCYTDVATPVFEMKHALLDLLKATVSANIRINVNLPTSTDDTAFSIALRHHRMAEANALLCADADYRPTVHYNPSQIISEKMIALSKLIGLIKEKNHDALREFFNAEENRAFICSTYYRSHSGLFFELFDDQPDKAISELLELAHREGQRVDGLHPLRFAYVSLKNLKERLEQQPIAEIRKNARIIIGQIRMPSNKLGFSRTQKSTLFRLPVEVLMNIASMTGGTYLTETERTQAVLSFCGKPS